MVRLVRTALIGGGIVLATAIVLMVLLPGSVEGPPGSSPTPRPASATTAPSPSAASQYDTETLTGPEYDTELTTGPTRSKSQSKVWFHDGRWWSLMLAPDVGEYRIFAFDPSTESWVDTGTPVDERRFARADVLWDGTHLVIVAAGGDEDSGRHAAEVTRFSYEVETGVWELDADFPVTLTEAGVGPMTVARDGAGVLWVTYVTDNQVMIIATNGDDRRWTEPMPMPAEHSTVAADEAAVVAYDGGIGVMWSNQSEHAIYYASHADGDPPTTWSATEEAVSGSGVADNHVSLRSADTPEGPIIVAVTKTSKDEQREGQQAALLLALVRSVDGTWSNSLVGRVADRHTRPALVIEDDRRLHVFATSPFDGGTIYHKVADLGELVFEPGLGEPFLTTGEQSSISNVSVPKQTVTPESGLVVIAADDTAGHYVSRAVSLGGAPFPEPMHEIVSGERLVIHDRFDAWAGGDPTQFGWAVAGGTATIEGESGSVVLRLTGGPDGARMCKPFPGLPGRAITATAVIRVDAFGTARSSIMKLRSAGSELFTVRIQSDGQLDYTDGTARLEGPVIDLGASLRVTATTTPDATSYALTIADAASGRVLLENAGMAIEPPDGAVDEVCFEASPNSEAGGVALDAVLIARVE